MYSWTKTELGQYILNEETLIYERIISETFGFFALQVGMDGLDFLKYSPIARKIHLSNEVGDVLANSEFLPFSQQSIDLVVLPHVLDFSEMPQQALREAERVLIPEGILVLTGFNPMSAWGLRRLMNKHCPNGTRLWEANFFSINRIRDWLGLLGFEVLEVKIAAHRMPFGRYGFTRLQVPRWAGFGGIYCIVAKKRVLGMHVIKPHWQKSRLKSPLIVTTTQKKQNTK
jgi:SAM-dependent methyltransferase